MTTFKIKPSAADVTGRHLHRTCDDLKKTIRGIFKLDPRTAYSGTAQGPAISVTMDVSQKATVPVDPAAELTALLRLFDDALLTVRDKSPGIIGQMDTVYGAKNVPEGVGALIIGHTVFLNARLGPLSRIKLLRNLLLSCERVASVGFPLPALPPGQSFKRLLATERRNGTTPVQITGELNGHQHGPKQAGLLKLWTGEVVAAIHTPGDSVALVMKGYVAGRAAAATVRIDRDLIFDEPRFVFVDWKWLGVQGDAFEALAA